MEIIEVETGQVKVARAPARLCCSALGSCVAVVLYDGVAGIGGIAHVMLPTTDQYLYGDDLLKYANEAIPYLLQQMVEMGANRYGLHARLVGGAMIVKDEIDIGSQVVQSCQDILHKYGIEIVAQRVGGSERRSATLDVTTSALWYKEGGGVDNAL